MKIDKNICYHPAILNDEIVYLNIRFYFDNWFGAIEPN